MDTEFGKREGIDRPRHYTRLRFGDLLFFFHEDVNLYSLPNTNEGKIECADFVINKKTNEIIKSRFPLEVIFELALLTYKNDDPIQVYLNSYR